MITFLLSPQCLTTMSLAMCQVACGMHSLPWLVPVEFIHLNLLFPQLLMYQHDENVSYGFVTGLSLDLFHFSHANKSSLRGENAHNAVNGQSNFE